MISINTTMGLTILNRARNVMYGCVLDRLAVPSDLESVLGCPESRSGVRIEVASRISHDRLLDLSRAPPDVLSQP